MSHVQGCRRERIGNLEGNDRYLVGLMVCVVGVGGPGIVGFYESGGLGILFSNWDPDGMGAEIRDSLPDRCRVFL